MKNTDKEIDLISIVKVIWKNRMQIIICGCIGIVIGLVVAFSIPAQYDCTVKVVAEGKNTSGSSNNLGGIAAMMGVNLHESSQNGISESVYPEIIKSSVFLDEFKNMKIKIENNEITLKEYLEKKQKQPWWRYITAAPMNFIGWIANIDTEESTDVKVDDKFRPTKDLTDFEKQLSAKIFMLADKKTGIYSISVMMQSPEVAAAVADSVVTKLKRYMVKYYTSKTRSDLIANQEMLKEAKKNYFVADSLYATAADRNVSLSTKSAQIKLNRLENEKNITFIVYQQLSSQVEITRVKLQENTPVITVIEPARVPINKASPNKKKILLACIFLGLFAKVGVIVGKQIIK